MRRPCARGKKGRETVVYRVLVRAGRPPHQPVGVEAAHAYRGVGTLSTNTGNLLFQDAVYRTLVGPGTELVVDSLGSERRGVNQAYIDRINEEFDMVVLPLANAFRDDYLTPLDRLTTVIEGLKIPVVVTGIGGQLPLDGDPRHSNPEINEAAARFVRAVLERSASIGVRGELTTGYLEHLGFDADRIDIIGCPSLHVSPPDTVVTRAAVRLDTDARIALNLTPSVVAARSLLEDNHPRFPNLTYLAQDNQTLGLLLWGEEFSAPPGMPGTLDHYLCTEDKLRVIIDPAPWLDFLRTQDFACGTRIHGNIAALLAGTPAFVLAHDSRTLELCRFHQIPHVRLEADGTAGGESLDAADLYDRTDLDGFNTARPAGYATWMAFLDRNHVPHGVSLDRAYEETLSQVPFPGAVRPVIHLNPTDLVSRLRWLHQGRRGDDVRTIGAYQPEFIPPGGRQLDVLERLARVRSTASDTAPRVKTLEQQVARLRKQVAKLSVPKPTFGQRLERRVRRILGMPPPKP